MKVGDSARIQELRDKLQEDPLNVNVRIALARQLEGAGKLGDSIKELETCVAKARRNLGISYCSYATALLQVKQPQAALQHLDTAIEVDPANASFYLSNKARALNQLGLHDQAKEICDKVLKQPDASKETQRIARASLKDSDHT